MIFSMHEGSTKLRELWASSKLGFKIAVVVSLLWVAVHTIGFAYAAINPNSDPTMTNIGVGADYNFYAQTGKILDQRGPIYDFISNPFPAFTLTNHPAFSLLSSVMVEFRPAIGETFKYHPAFALLFSWLNKLPVEAIKAIWYFLLTVGYLGGVLVWFLVFSRLQSFDWHLVGYVALVPLIAYDWIGTMAFGNVSPLLLLFNALLILSIIDRRPGWAGFLTAILLMLKFYWCFPLIVLVVFKEWRLLARIWSIVYFSTQGSL